MKGSILTVFACAASLVVAGTAQARGACWERVITDWSADSRLTGTYTVGCYREALAKLPEDLRAYSSAPDDIRRGLQAQLARAPAAPEASTQQPEGSGGGSRLFVLAAVLAAVLVVGVLALR